MKSHKQSRGDAGIIRGPFELMVLATAALVTGVVRLVLLRHFSLAQIFYCLVAIPASILLIMILDYAMHHARLAALMVLVILLLLAISRASFCVGLGLALLGMIVTKWP
jgi:hypothetical protein